MWAKREPGSASRRPSQSETATGEIGNRRSQRMIDSGMMAHGEGYGISRYARWLRVWRRSYVKQKEDRYCKCRRRRVRGRGEKGMLKQGSAQYLFRDNERMRNVSPAVSEMSEPSPGGCSFSLNSYCMLSMLLIPIFELPSHNHGRLNIKAEHNFEWENPVVEVRL